MNYLKSASAFFLAFAVIGASSASAQTCYENRQVESVCNVQVLISDYTSAFASTGNEQSGNSAHFGSDVNFDQSLVDESYYVTAQRPCMVTRAVAVACAGSGGGDGGNGGRNYDNDGDGYSDDGSDNPGNPM